MKRPGAPAGADDLPVGLPRDASSTLRDPDAPWLSGGGGRWTLAVLVTSVLASILWAQPLRETPLEDDFAYAWSVAGWLKTGRLELHDWASAAPLTTIGLGALASRVSGGFSFSALRLVTLVLALASLPAIAKLARLHGSGSTGGLLVAFSVWACPLFFRFSFNFMTDVPFVALSMMALATMTRALRDGDLRRMLAGSVLAAAAVLTRQFAAAIVPALALTWWLDPARTRRTALYLSGAALPAIAALLQLYLGLAHPTWAGAMNGYRTVAYWSDVQGLAWQWPWRLAVVLQYAGLFALPILSAHCWAVWRRRALRVRWLLLASGGLVVGTLAGVLFGYATPWMPLVGWNGGGLIELGDAVVTGSTVAAALAGVAAGHLLLERVAQLATLSPEEKLLDAFVLFSLALTLVYVQLGDEYLLVYLPYLAVLSARALPDSRPALASLLAALVASTALGASWTRGVLARAEPPWQLAEAAVERGVPPRCISGAGGWQWMAYHTMDDFVARYDPEVESPRGFWLFWSEWIPRRKANALAYFGPVPSRPDNPIPGPPALTRALAGDPTTIYGLWMVEPDSAEWHRRLALCGARAQAGGEAGAGE